MWGKCARGRHPRRARERKKENRTDLRLRQLAPNEDSSYERMESDEAGKGEVLVAQWTILCILFTLAPTPAQNVMEAQATTTLRPPVCGRYRTWVGHAWSQSGRQPLQAMVARTVIPLSDLWLRDTVGRKRKLHERLDQSGSEPITWRNWLSHRST